MSEEEIDKKIQDLIHKLEKMMSTSIEFIGTDIKVFMSEDDKKVLLDLISLCLELSREYTKEKEKNKELQNKTKEYEKIFNRQKELEQEKSNLMKQGWL